MPFESLEDNKCGEYDRTDGISIVEMYVNSNIYQDKVVNRPHTSSVCPV